MTNPPIFFAKGDIPPTSNAERQREFRQRNPGYYGRLQAKRRAPQKALRAKIKAEMAQRFLAEQAAMKREPLMLPAPVETIEIPGMNMIGEIRTPAPVSVRMSS